jgi:hypothetical protein
MKNYIPIYSAILTFIILFVLYQSYMPHPEVYRSLNSVVTRVERTEDSTEIEYYSKLQVDSYHNNASMQRQLYNINSKLIYDFPMTYRYYDIGGIKESLNILEAPRSMPAGDYIIRTTIIWQPLASIEDHWYTLPDIPFVIPSLSK